MPSIIYTIYKITKIIVHNVPLLPCLLFFSRKGGQKRDRVGLGRRCWLLVEIIFFVSIAVRGYLVSSYSSSRFFYLKKLVGLFMLG